MSGRRSLTKGARTERSIVNASWLDGRDVLIVKADRREPLVIVRLPLAAEIAKLVA